MTSTATRIALRALTELSPDDSRRHGLVQWLLLNKKLNHWKSTRATAEAIYSLVHYLEREGTLGAREEAVVRIGRREQRFEFEPDSYTGRKVQVVLSGEEIDPETDSTIVVEKETPGFLFASATWHFSTEKLPEEARGDFFSVMCPRDPASLTGGEDRNHDSLIVRPIVVFVATRSTFVNAELAS